MTKVISLDTSSSCTGWACFINGEFERSGCINLKKIKNGDERLKEMCMSIIDLIEAEQPDLVYVEQTSVARNVQAQRMLTILLGAVWGYCVQNKIWYQAFRPTEWRSWIKNEDEKLPRKRDELKQWSIHRVKELFDKDVEDDEADAILIGAASIKHFTD